MSQVLFDYLDQYIELTNEEQQFIRELDLFQHFSKNDILLKAGQYTSNGYFVEGLHQMLLPGRWPGENNRLLYRTGIPGTSLRH
ncbi:hypothetical protein [Niabella hibiscisoli]|uniref:hypothetical protein n=1 Tax=Niabella hibiscisoli TaxID=1825928 RepID=UPI001F0D5A0B|nr:hypothetical protein [Niabella hibiscisoli]MCH5716475.1 hypothetical protein [Niabella hibiscisoli]